MYEALHKRLLRRWWRRLLVGQPSVGLEVHCDRDAWLSLTCPAGSESLVEAALRSAYPNCRLERMTRAPGVPPCVLRLKKHGLFTKRAKQVDRFEHDRAPAVNKLITTMAACGAPAFIQVALTPTPVLFEGHAKRSYKRHERHLSRERKLSLPPADPSMVEREELIGGLDIQHRPLFFADLRVVGPTRAVCERIASELRACTAENRLVERGTTVRQSWLGLYTRRILRGEGNPLPSPRKGVFASTELASIWHLPSVDYATVPFARSPLPSAPASPAILRPREGMGTLRDAHGPVSIHPPLRRQNTAVPGTVEQGKSSYLVATVAEDLRRERCAVIVLDPKGDAAEAAVSLVPCERTCTLLDFAHPTCGFNPLAVDAPADTIADYVVASLKQLFSEGDIKASSDRYLRNAIIAVLAYDPSSTLWDAARLLSVGEEGYAYRSRVAGRLRSQPEFKEISEFFTGELSAQLADARGTTTAKLDAPVNKLARLLNSPSIKRVLLNDSLRVDFDEVISTGQVLVVKGALGAMGAGNTSVLMQLLVGMLDAALARRQDGIPAEQRTAVALKIDEAPLVVNRGFAETLALKRSAGLETVACWQTNSQWIDRDVRAQLDALFAHRVYFATASVDDAREAASLMMAEFSDTVRPGIRNLSDLGRPDVRMHLPRHSAIASWVTPEGRQAPFVARTLPLPLDERRLAFHAARQAERGGRFCDDLSQPHWQRGEQDGKSDRAKRDPQQSQHDPVVIDTATVEAAAIDAATADATTPYANAADMAAGTPAIDTPASDAKPSEPSESYSELANLDAAHSVRWAKPATALRSLEPEPLDIEILLLIASMRHVLSSQIHRRFNNERAVTTTQRRLKRLSDAGLLARFQFHRRDGGGVPMCYSITPLGLKLSRDHGRPRERAISTGDVPGGHEPSPPNPPTGDRLLHQARHDVHVTGWVLALQAALPTHRFELTGPHESAISPPSRSRDGDRAMLSLADLCLPGGRTPHDFLHTVEPGARVEVDRFQSIRPGATLRSKDGPELLVERDDRLPEGPGAAKLERYDHFLAGWSAHLTRYRSPSAKFPIVVFVCRDHARARECARRADRILTASRAYAGEYPADWEYPGRERILFTAERDAHEGLLGAWGVPRLPPEVRVAVAQGDPRARDPLLERRNLVKPACSLPAGPASS
ncbi:MAG TPA: replication-relaxation family protein [Solirubrobacteraceae bacterium]|nr:replication-relaxation family protein [Solirubrobacteraceae bacterium]